MFGHGFRTGLGFWLAGLAIYMALAVLATLVYHATGLVFVPFGVN